MIKQFFRNSQIIGKTLWTYITYSSILSSKFQYKPVYLSVNLKIASKY